MNNRIEEILKQSTHDTMGVKQVDQKQFAELIVRECAKIADDGFGSTNFGNGISGAQVLKHFGVEE